MRRVHGRICREREVNLYLHSQHLSEEKNFKNERQFAESRPIEHGEHNVSLCGQTHIENKKTNGTGIAPSWTQIV